VKCNAAPGLSVEPVALIAIDVSVGGETLFGEELAPPQLRSVASNTHRHKAVRDFIRQVDVGLSMFREDPEKRYRASRKSSAKSTEILSSETKWQAQPPKSAQFVVRRGTTIGVRPLLLKTPPAKESFWSGEDFALQGGLWMDARAGLFLEPCCVR
jgi:hypothetical protein